MKAWMVWAVLFCSLLFLPGCNQAREVAARTLEEMLKAGTITVDQYRALLAAMTGGDFWAEAGKILGSIGGAVLASLTGVRLWRGGVNNRHGAAPAGK